MDALFAVPEPRNETVRDYAPGSAQATSLQKRLGELASSADRSDHDDRRQAADGRRRCDQAWSSRTSTRTCSA